MVTVGPAGFNSITGNSFPSGKGAAKRSQTSPHGLSYPSPFLDIANNYMPSNMKGLIRLCSYYSTVNPIVHAAVVKKAEFPITEFVYESAEQEESDQWKNLLEDTLDLRAKLVEIGMNYWATGNVFISVFLPFKRYLICEECDGFKTPLKKAKFQFRKYKFIGTCANCNSRGQKKVVDVPLKKNRSGIRLIVWDPMNIEVDHNPTSGERIYKYSPSGDLKRAIKSGEPKYYLETIPLEFIDAIKENKQIVFNPNKIFHFRRPSLATVDLGWGLPTIVASLKYLFVAQIFIKSREILAHQHIIPLWVLFPQAGNGELNPFEHLNLEQWKGRIEVEIEKWRQDPAYFPVVPIPLGFQHVGGTGTQMSIVPELQQISEEIMAGMLVPREFIMGGLSYSGTSVSIRMMEVHFLTYRGLIHRFINKFLIPKLSKFTGLSETTIKLSDLRMADDVQRKQMLINLAAQDKLSWDTLHSELGIDYEKEMQKIQSEKKDFAEMQVEAAKEQARAQGEQQIVMAKYSMKVQVVQQELMKDMEEELLGQGRDPETVKAILAQVMESGGLNLPMDLLKQLHGEAKEEVSSGDTEIPSGIDNQFVPIDLEATADTWAKQLANISDPNQQAEMMQQLRQMSQPFYQEVLNRVQQLQNQVDMRPMPDQLPPRRNTTSP